MRKALHGHFDPYLGNWFIPPQRLFSRRTRNLLPLSSKQLEPKSDPPQDVQEKLINSKQKQAYYYILKGKAYLSCSLDRLSIWRGPTSLPGRKLFSRKRLAHVPMWLYRVVELTDEITDSWARAISASSGPSPVVKPAAEYVELAPPPTVTTSSPIAKPPELFRKFATYT